MAKGKNKGWVASGKVNKTERPLVIERYEIHSEYLCKGKYMLLYGKHKYYYAQKSESLSLLNGVLFSLKVK